MGVLNRNITKPEGRLLYTDGRPYSFLADYIYAQLHYNQKSVAGSVIQATARAGWILSNLEILNMFFLFVDILVIYLFIQAVQLTK